MDMHLNLLKSHLPKYFIALMLCCLVAPQTEAQRKKKEPKVNPVEVAHKMMCAGNFDEAQEYIAKELTTQKKKRKPTCNVDSLKWLANTMRAAEANIRSTQHIVFIDSVILPKRDIIGHLELNPEMGTICSIQEVKKELELPLNQCGEMAYINALNDYAFLAIKQDSTSTLCSTIRTGNRWSHPEPLNIPDLDGANQDFPFLLADGVNLYFAAQAEDGFGGWDIYVTRYDGEEKTFLKPQNIGMPFNSEANDYMYYIDESSNTGYFLTDRRLSNDSVCLYTFIPNASHISYPSGTDFLTLFRAANISSIAETQEGQEMRIEEWKEKNANRSTNVAGKHTTLFIINNELVYRDLKSFKSEEAKAEAETLITLNNSLQAHEKLFNILRKQYSNNPTPTLHDNIIQIELEREQCIKEIKQREKRLRELENQTLNE